MPHSVSLAQAEMSLEPYSYLISDMAKQGLSSAEIIIISYSTVIKKTLRGLLKLSQHPVQYDPDYNHLKL